MVDASVVDHSTSLSVFWVIEDETKAISCQAVCYVHSVLEAELEAIHLALVVAIEERYSSVVIVSDSAIVVEALNIKELPLAWGSYLIFRKCVSLLKYFPYLLNLLIVLVRVFELLEQFVWVRRLLCEHCLRENAETASAPFLRMHRHLVRCVRRLNGPVRRSSARPVPELRVPALPPSRHTKRR
ncbi:hypothetical protein F8388_018137 [Cannabis sativa]|uniref:RNase H type-1 domain-containing protein n=1 Tax=Cannabis sativa TaxID=3483 RepID=A0A7J6GJ11_CANSA|nr:hypothetical protein G4B88_010076 [Cannabis sativa]KAF4395863.1 hypothetical protein F8388_018137 [Cannabis sativa]